MAELIPSEKTFTLLDSIEGANGDIRELKFRRPKMKEIRQAAQVKDEVGQTYKLIELCVVDETLAQAIIDQLDPSDFETIIDFLNSERRPTTRKRGGKS